VPSFHDIMQDYRPADNQAIDQRRMLSSALLVRFILLVGATIVIATLPWPYPLWMKAVPIAIWTLQGIVTSRSLPSASTPHDVRIISRWLLGVDTLVAAAVTYLYIPLYHDVWAFMLVLIIFGSTQDRRMAPIVTGAVMTAVIVAAWQYPASRPASVVNPWNIAIDIAVVWMVAVGMELFLRAIWDRSLSLAAESAQMKSAASAQAALRVASEAQAEHMQRVIELAVTLMRERELGPLLDRILDATTQTFGFRCGAIMTAERDREVFAYRSVRGYAADQTRRLMVREVPFAQASLKTDVKFQLRPSVFYAPVERQAWHTDPLTCFRPELALLPREHRNAWHEADTLVFTLTSSTGETIGLLCPDAPLDGLVPSMETIDNVAMFARLAAAAIENVYLASVEPHREAAQRVARTLDLTAAIFTERDLDALLHRIVSATLDSFGFNAGTILLREAGRDAYVRRAAVGFPREVEGAEVSGASLREMMNERTRVRDTFYYVPMELNVQGGVTRDPNRANLPRLESGQWHESDLILFPIFDSNKSLIGVLTPDDPKDRRVPAYETIQQLETFARIAGLAIETALIRSMATSNSL
jgi:transcriptional regulator with GAF, ATPase, and Fis domain